MCKDIMTKETIYVYLYSVCVISGYRCASPGTFSLKNTNINKKQLVACYF